MIKESVRGIVEYVLKSGSLDDRFMSIGRAMEGTIAHGKLQKDNENIYEDYQKEVKLQWGFIRDNIELIIEGRTDGIIKESNNVIIEEIQNKIYEVTGNINMVPHVFKFRKKFPYAKSGKRDTLKMMNENDGFIEIDFIVKTEKILKRKLEMSLC